MGDTSQPARFYPLPPLAFPCYNPRGPATRPKNLAWCRIRLGWVFCIVTVGNTNIAGIPFTSLAQLLPFILIGIGVDDMVQYTHCRRRWLHFL